MIRLNNDYCHGAIPEILEALQTTNSEAYAGYELDEWCERAGSLIKEAAACPDAAVHYIVGGTQANVAFIAHALRPWESVVCADCGHINVHETGATEHIGHKCETVPARDGKLAASDLRAVAQGYAESSVSEHVTVPRMAYISFPSESGTVYSLAELEALRAVCDEFGMYLFVDGARLAYGLAASGNDVTLPDIARLSDAFYIGGTKCGALFGEAMVVVNPALQPYFRNSMKQAGTMLAKGWLLGLQFTKLFEGGRYLEIGKVAVAQAMRIKAALAKRGLLAEPDSPTNQQFALVSDAQLTSLSEACIVEFEGKEADSRNMVRFCTSWSTTDDEVDAVVAAIEGLPE